MTCRLLDLVDELILSIIAEINSLHALRSLARTCSRLQVLAEPAIYHHIFLRTPEDASSLATSIVSRPDRLHAIRSIEARQQYNREECRLDTLTNIVHRAANLQNFTLESPYCNRVQPSARYGWAAKMAASLRPVFDFSLSRLTTLTLHLSLEDERYWPIDGGSGLVFAHPTLRSLKLSCASIGDDVAETLQQQPCTPLKRLALIECNVTQKAVTSILAIPSALEHLSLGENCAHRRMQSGNFNRLFSKNPVAFLTSLKQQDSLQTLGYATSAASPTSETFPRQASSSAPSWYDPLTCSGLSTFNSLRHISLQGCWTEFENLFQASQTAPPNLQSLTLTQPSLDSFFPRDSDRISWVPSVSANIQSLQCIDIVASSMPTRHVEGPLTSMQGALQKRSLSVRMFRRKGMAAIPPFLYGERAYLDEEAGALEDDEVQRIALFKPELLQGNCLEYS